MSTSDVYVETGSRRCFACSLEWPGWCRSGKTEGEALETLLAYAPRYAIVVAAAGLRFPDRAQEQADVVEHVEGSMATDFGVPGMGVLLVLAVVVGYLYKVVMPQYPRRGQQVLEQPESRQKT